MERLGNELSAVLAKLQSPGLDAARRAVRIDATGDVIAGVVMLLFFLALVGLARWFWKASPFGDDITDRIIPTGLACLLATMLLVMTLGKLANPWTWAGFTDPDTIIAAKILKI